MAGGKSIFLDSLLLNWIFGGVAYTFPSTLYCALFTTSPDSSGGGVEVSGGSYARSSVERNQTNFPATTTPSLSNAVEIAFSTATDNWGTVVAAAFFDASSGGNMLYWGPLATSQTVSNGSTFRFPANTGFIGTES